MTSKQLKERHHEQIHNIKALYHKGCYTQEEIHAIISKMYGYKLPRFIISKTIKEMQSTR